MKAKQYGTPTEYLRWLAGWRSPTECAADGIQARCIDCRYHAAPDIVRQLKGSPKCLLLGLATRSNATCRRYRPPADVIAIARHEEESE